MFKGIRPFLTKHEPEILMGMGIGGLIFSTGWAIKATFDAAKAINRYKESKNIEKITKKEAIKLTWRYYWPVAASMIISIPCVIASNRISNKRYIALATAYTVSEAAFQEYRDKTREIVGDKKAKDIQEAVNADKIKQTYDNTKIILTGNGESVFYEPISGRYFKTTWNDIAKVANELNAEAIGSFGEITLNDWFERLGLEQTSIGDSVGWTLDGNPTNLIDIEISSHITTDNIPVGAISYKRQPKAL